MPGTITKPRRRLTREESRAQTRATQIAIGSEHFLRYGLGGAVAEKIAEDAGYSRGALYSNFDGKEDLFFAVIREGRNAGRMSFTPFSKKNLRPKQRRAGERRLKHHSSGLAGAAGNPVASRLRTRQATI